MKQLIVSSILAMVVCTTVSPTIARQRDAIFDFESGTWRNDRLAYLRANAPLGGGYTRWYGRATDIEDRKQGEDRLLNHQNSHLRYRRFVVPK